LNPVSTERVVKVLLYTAIFFSIIILPIVIIWVVVNGVVAIDWEFLTMGPYQMYKGGIYPQIVGSIYLVGLSSIFGTPLGIASAIYLSEYAPDNPITRTVRFFTETLAGMPSIVIGLFGLEFLVFTLQFQYSLLSGALSLSFMMLPWTIRASEEAIKVVPSEYREASLALGATKWQTILKVVLPTSAPGIITGILLGMGKAIGETAVVMLTAGSGYEWLPPRGIFSPAGSLPMYIFNMVTQGHTKEAFQNAFGAATLLIFIFLMMSIASLLIRNYYLRKLGQ
jgi:phosphate transport system permease protein